MAKRGILIFVLTIVLFCSACVFISSPYVAHPEKITVVIDAGHGGIDGGASGVKTDMPESEINLAVATKLGEYFENAGINVVYTRKTPAGLYGVLSRGFKNRDLAKRVEITERADADIFISIHMNEYSSRSRCGAQVFCKEDENSRTLAKYIQSELDKIDSDNRQGNVLEGDYYVLNNSPVPAVICECGFLSSPEDEAKLVTDEYQSALAYSIFLGSVEYFYNSANGLNVEY